MEMFLQHGERGLCCGIFYFLVLDKIAENGIFFLADRCFKRNRLAGNILDLFYTLDVPTQLFGDFFIGWFPTVNSG